VNKKYISFPVRFDLDEDRHVYIIKKKESTDKPKSLTQANSAVDVDTSVAKDPNFLPASLGQTLKYGGKELKYLGLVQGEKTSISRTQTASNLTSEIEEEMGQTGAVCKFEYKDTVTGLTQKFIMTPRYYQSAEAKDDGDGLYEFRPLTGISKLYSQVDKVEAKEGDHSGQFLITFQQKEATNDTDPENNHVAVRRVVAAVELSEISDFMKFEVTLNEIPIGNYKGEKSKAFFQKQKDAERGKDIVIDWEFLDNFDTDSKLWYNSNGLDMHQKKLWSRKDYQVVETDNVASNFYPVTSAIVIRDKNSNKQVTIMPDRPQSGSAGLRGNKNIELMQNRRHNIND